MAYTTSPAPAKEERHQVVIVVDGPVDAKKWKEFKACIKKCVEEMRSGAEAAGIGIRGLVSKRTESYIYPKPSDLPKP